MTGGLPCKPPRLSSTVKGPKRDSRNGVLVPCSMAGDRLLPSKCNPCYGQTCLESRSYTLSGTS